MTLPTPRNSIRPVRGLLATLQADIAGIGEGEICYATDENRFYVKESGILTVASATAAQGVLANTAIQPNDNISTLVNDSAYITLADISQTTSKQVYVSATDGDDATGELDNPGKPFLTIKAALDEIANQSLTGYAIIIGPGTYYENNPVTVPNGCTLLSAHGSYSHVHGSVKVFPLVLTDHLFQLTNLSGIDGLELHTPSSTEKACVNFVGTANNQECSVNNCTFIGGVSGSNGAAIANNTPTGNARINCDNIYYGGGDFFHFIETHGGRITATNIFVQEFGGVDDGMHCVFRTDYDTGNTISEIIAFNCEARLSTLGSFYTAVGGNVDFFNVIVTGNARGLRLDGNNYNVKAVNCVFKGSGNTVRIGSACDGSDGSKFYLSGVHNNDFRVDNQLWWASDYLLEFSTDLDDNENPAADRKIWGADLSVGNSRIPHGLSVGNGIAFANTTEEVVLATSSNTSTTEGVGLVDISANALDKNTALTFTFNANAADEAIYFGTKKRDGSSLLLKHYGYKLQTLTGDARDGAYVIEIWNGSTWTEVKCQTVNAEEGYNYASNYFWRNNSSEIVMFGIDDNAQWSLKTINTVQAYWSRIRIVTAPTVLPVFTQVAGLPKAQFIVTKKGKQTFFGAAQFRRSLQAASSSLSSTGGVLTGTQQIGTGTNQYSHSFANATLDGAGDKLYWNTRIPEGSCTAFPFYIDISYSIASGFDAVTKPQLGFTFDAHEVVGMYVADPNGGIAPVARTSVDTDLITSNNPQRNILTIPGDSQNKIYNISFGPYYANDYYEGDMITIALDYVDDGSSNADITFWDFSIRSFRWTEGERQG